MLKKQVVRAKLEKLLAGGADARDVDAVWKFVRSHSHGVASVREIGDLLAHSDRKDRGPSVEHSGRLFDMIERLMEYTDARRAGTAIPPVSLTKDGPHLLDRLSMMTPDFVAKESGLTKGKAEKALRQAIKHDEQGRGLSAIETSVAQMVATTIPISPWLSQERLEHDLLLVLKKEKLLLKGEENAIRAALPLFSLIIITDAHLCEIMTKGGREGTLYAGSDLDGNLELTLHFPARGLSNRPGLCAGLLETKLGVSHYVESGNEPDEGLVAPNMSEPGTPHVDVARRWSRPVELVNGKIRIIGR